MTRGTAPNSTHVSQGVVQFRKPLGGDIWFIGSVLCDQLSSPKDSLEGHRRLFDKGPLFTANCHIVLHSSLFRTGYISLRSLRISDQLGLELREDDTRDRPFELEIDKRYISEISSAQWLGYVIAFSFFWSSAKKKKKKSQNEVYLSTSRPEKDMFSIKNGSLDPDPSTNTYQKGKGLVGYTYNLPVLTPRKCTEGMAYSFSGEIVVSVE